MFFTNSVPWPISVTQVELDNQVKWAKEELERILKLSPKETEANLE